MAVRIRDTGWPFFLPKYTFTTYIFWSITCTICVCVCVCAFRGGEILSGRSFLRPGEGEEGGGGLPVSNFLRQARVRLLTTLLSTPPPPQPPNNPFPIHIGKLFRRSDSVWGGGGEWERGRGRGEFWEMHRKNLPCQIARGIKFALTTGIQMSAGHDSLVRRTGNSTRNL